MWGCTHSICLVFVIKRWQICHTWVHTGIDGGSVSSCLVVCLMSWQLCDACGNWKTCTPRKGLFICLYVMGYFLLVQICVSVVTSPVDCVPAKLLSRWLRFVRSMEDKVEIIWTLSSLSSTMAHGCCRELLLLITWLWHFYLCLVKPPLTTDYCSNWADT